MNDLQTLKKEWLKDMKGMDLEDLAKRRIQAATNSINAAVGRNMVYCAKGVSYGDKQRFKKAWKEQLEKEARDYCGRSGISDKAHVEKIKSIANYLSKEFSECNILAGGRLRFGTSQKAFNLYLKYLWCFDEVKTPPHCPIDRIILNRAWKEDTPGVREILRKVCYVWTKSDCIKDYQGWIEACNKVAEKKYPSLSEWELVVWSKEKENEQRK